MTASEIIKKLRKENNLSQARLAEIAGVATETVSNWEHGKYEPPYNTVVRILGALCYHLEIKDDYYEDRSKRTLEGVTFNIC